MKTQELTLIRPAKYGITEKKKAELDDLTNQVLDAQHDLQQYQAIVSSLTAKQANFQGFLTTAETTRQLALSNKNLMDALVEHTLNLRDNSEIAFNEIVEADVKTKQVATEIKMVMDELIYVADLVNKLSNFILRKKALNPLISDELITLIGTAGKDANNAVALTLVALKATFAAQATNMESEAAMALEYNQSLILYRIMTGTGPDGKPNPKQPISLRLLLDQAYVNAKLDYEQAHEALILASKQLNKANSDLNKAQVKLRSLQSGLAAANAAALAS